MKRTDGTRMDEELVAEIQEMQEALDKLDEALTEGSANPDARNFDYPFRMGAMMGAMSKFHGVLMERVNRLGD